MLRKTLPILALLSFVMPAVQAGDQTELFSAPAAPSGEGILPGLAQPIPLLHSGDDLASSSGEGGDELDVLGAAVGHAESPAAFGLPGIDGLTASTAAYQNALDGLDPRLVRFVLGNADPSVLRHVTQSLSAPLPGLNEEPVQTLPGIDGLPVSLPE